MKHNGLYLLKHANANTATEAEKVDPILLINNTDKVLLITSQSSHSDVLFSIVSNSDYCFLFC